MTFQRPSPLASIAPMTHRVGGTHRLARGSVLGGLAFMLSVSGCIDDAGVEHEPPSYAPGQVERPLRPGVSATVGAHLEPVYCSASLRCQDHGSVDAPGAHLVTGLSCAFDGGPSVPPRDTLIAFHRRVLCYFEGSPEDPATWIPASGQAITPDDEDAYGAIMNAYGDAYYNTSSRIDPWSGYAFCRFEAFGSVASAPDTGGQRTTRHTTGAVVAHWEAVIAAEYDGSWACGGSAQLGYAHAAVHSRPAPAAQGAFPATHDMLVLLEAELPTDDPAYPFGVFHGLGLAFGLGSTFPTNAATVPALDERRLWVADPVDASPLDVAIAQSCVSLDGDGQLLRIAVAVDDRWTGAPLGGVFIEADHDGTPFDCARDPAGACALVPFEDLAAEAPCLFAGSP